MLDQAGRLVGMAVPLGHRRSRRGALAIPVETIFRVVEVLRTRGRVARGYLGLATQSVQVGPGPAGDRPAGDRPAGDRPGAAGRGLIVVGIDPQGPAAQAGMLLGDVLVAWDGVALGTVREMLTRLDPDSVGTEVVLDLVRAGQPARLTVRISERAAA